MSQLCVVLMLICSLPYLWRDFPSGANAPHFAVAFASIGVDTGDSDRLCLPTNENFEPGLEFSIGIEFLRSQGPLGKVPCTKFLSGTSQGRGKGYPDARVPDVAGISSPKTLSLVSLFRS